MRLSKEEKQIVSEIADEVMDLLKEKGLSLRLKHYVVHEASLRIVLEKYHDEESTYEFLKRIPGLGNSALRIAEKYPTIIELITTDARSLKLIYRVGEKTVQKIYDALVSDGKIPRWTP